MRKAEDGAHGRDKDPPGGRAEMRIPCGQILVNGVVSAASVHMII
jgi:hypothetical protein